MGKSATLLTGIRSKMDFIANPFGGMTGDMGASIHTPWAMVRVREDSVQKVCPEFSQLLVRALATIPPLPETLIWILFFGML